MARMRPPQAPTRDRPWLPVLAVAAVLAGFLMLWHSGGKEAPAEEPSSLTRRDPARPPAPPPRRRPGADRIGTPRSQLATRVQRDDPARHPSVQRMRELHPDQAVLYIQVVSAGGWFEADARVLSPDCGLDLPVDEGITRVVLPPGRCTLSAQRRDGLLGAPSGAEQVELEAGGLHRVTLVVPEARQAGLGVRIQPHRLGYQVVEVLPDTPASDLGLLAGQIIEEVDGIPTSELTGREVVELITGAEDSDVPFTVGWSSGGSWQRETRQLVREFLTDGEEPAPPALPPPGQERWWMGADGERVVPMDGDFDRSAVSQEPDFSSSRSS